jgi:hypothetical protein
MSVDHTLIRATSPTCMVITPSSQPIRNRAVSVTLIEWFTWLTMTLQTCEVLPYDVKLDWTGYEQ